MENNIKILRDIWANLYGDSQLQLLENLCDKLNKYSHKFSNDSPTLWYKNAVVYSLYVDKFNNNFEGIIDKLDYLKSLGVNCLWLLPILDSPLKDGGFDVSDYYNIRPSLLGDSLSEDSISEDSLSEDSLSGDKISEDSISKGSRLKDSISGDSISEGSISKGSLSGGYDKILDIPNDTFDNFIDVMHKNNIKVIFDLPLNHCSSNHKWFLEAKKDKESKYRDYFVWSKDKNLYKESGILFSGLSKSNWTKANKEDDEYYFHRFFEFQPDLNYKNPQVLVEMTNVVIHWLNKGVDGFRLDAIPFIWKEEKTDCRNLPQTHLIVKFLRAAANIVNNNVLMLAEACQPINKIVKYINDDLECNGAYNFPLITSIYKSFATKNKIHIENILKDGVFKQIHQNAQWFLFLRGHDELSFEKDYVNDKDRENLFNYYCKDKRWSFRNDEGIASRLSEIFNFDLKKILLANSLLLTLPCTPIIYYGDELAKGNDYSYFDKFNLKNKNDDSKDIIDKRIGNDNNDINYTNKNNYSKDIIDDQSFNNFEGEVIDARNIMRGSINWDLVDKHLETKSSLTFQVFNMLKKMISERNLYKVFGEGKLEIVDTKLDSVLAYKRVLDPKLDSKEDPKLDSKENSKEDPKEVLVLNNLSDSVVKVEIKNLVNVTLDSYDFKWLELSC